MLFYCVMKDAVTIFEKLWNNRARLLIVLAMTALYFFSYFQRVAIPGTIFDELQTAFGASAASITLLGALTIYVYASTQVFVGIMLDRFGAASVLLAGAAIMTVGSILFPLSHSLAVLYAMRILVGLGASLIFLSLVKEIAERFDERHFAMVLSVAIFLGYFGGVAGTFPFERAVNAFGWRTPLLAAGLLCGITLVWAWRLLHTAHRVGGRDEGFSMAVLLEILRNRSIISVGCAGTVSFGIYFLFQSAIGKKLLAGLRRFQFRGRGIVYAGDDRGQYDRRGVFRFSFTAGGQPPQTIFAHRHALGVFLHRRHHPDPLAKT